MRLMRLLFARIAGIFTRDRHGADLEEELASHLAMETEELVRRGRSPEEARRLAGVHAGSVSQASEAVRDQRGLPWLEDIVADFRYAVRSLRRAPGYTAVVITTLALGIGANIAIFSVTWGVLLKPLPHRNGDRLLYLRQAADGLGQQNVNFSVPEVHDLREGVHSLSGVAEYSQWSGTLRTDAEAARFNAGLVTGNYFEVMGLAPALGRLTSPSDDGVGVEPVMVLTHRFWRQRFGGDSAVIGRQVRVDGASVRVIGVVEAAPTFPDRIDALLNMVISPHHVSAAMVQHREHRMTEVVARLAPAATVDAARNEIGAVYARMKRDHREAYDSSLRYRVDVIPFKTAIGERAQLTMWLLMGAAAFVLIIAAANVTNLTLMRGVRRRRELVVRAALGAGTSRLRRLLFVENMVLTLGGTALGVVIAIGGAGMLVSLAERYSHRANEIQLDGVVVAFAIAVAVAVAFLLTITGAIPREGRFAPAVIGGAQRMTASLRNNRLQRTLVVAQVAVSVVLLAGAGLLVRTTLRLSAVETGLQTQEVLTFPIWMPSRPGDSPLVNGSRAQYEVILNEIRGVPGVVEVASGSTMPLRSSSIVFEVAAEGRPLGVGESPPRAESRWVGPAYFHASGIPLLGGRDFTDNDLTDSGKVVIVNKALARRLFPNDDNPVGRRIAWTGEILRITTFITGEWRTIVGVVGDTRDGEVDADARPVVFSPEVGGGVVIRAAGHAAALAAPVTRIIRRIEPAAAIGEVLTVAQIKDESVAPRRLNAELVSSFGLLAVLIAAVGIAGVLAFSVSARTNEIGIRMSLGADRGRVQRMILGEGGALLAVGLALGLFAAALMGSAIRRLLYEVEPHDPFTLTAVAVAMVSVGLLACWIPARRASRVDPVSAIRA